MNRAQLFLVMALALCACHFEEPQKSTTINHANFIIGSVLIQPLDDVDVESIVNIQHAIADSFLVSVTILPTKKLPISAWYEPRKRYCADSLLQWLKPLSANSRQKVLGITGKDISTKTIRQSNWGVMGLSYVPGNVCIVSDYRLQKHGTTIAKVREKLLKVVLHELGHTAGLHHCEQPFCLMADAEGKDNLDQQNQYCYSCRTILFGQ